MSVWNAKSQFFPNRVDWRLGLATWLSRESKPWVNWMAKLDSLSYSAPAGVTVQLLFMLHLCASFGDLQAASKPWDLVVSSLLNAQSWAHTLPLHDSHINTGFLSAELQANWHGIKPTKWLIKFNLKISKKSKSIRVRKFHSYLIMEEAKIFWWGAQIRPHV